MCMERLIDIRDKYNKNGFHITTDDIHKCIIATANLHNVTYDRVFSDVSYYISLKKNEIYNPLWILIMSMEHICKSLSYESFKSINEVTAEVSIDHKQYIFNMEILCHLPHRFFLIDDHLKYYHPPHESDNTMCNHLL